MDDLPSFAEQLNLPNSLLLPVAFGVAAYSGLRMMAEQFAAVAKALGPLGRRWTQLREQRVARAANVADLTKQVVKLTETVEIQAREIAWLRRMRDENAYTQDLLQQNRGLAGNVSQLRAERELLDAYIDYDLGWHRIANHVWQSTEDRATIAAEVPLHISVMEFGRKWRADRAATPDESV